MLFKNPKEPSSSAEYIFGRYTIINEEWEPYLLGW